MTVDEFEHAREQFERTRQEFERIAVLSDQRRLLIARTGKARLLEKHDDVLRLSVDYRGPITSFGRVDIPEGHYQVVLFLIPRSEK